MNVETNATMKNCQILNGNAKATMKNCQILNGKAKATMQMQNTQILNGHAKAAMSKMGAIAVQMANKLSHVGETTKVPLGIMKKTWLIQFASQ